MAVTGTHPRLAAALDAMNAGTEGWPGEIVAIGLSARLAAQEGRRCECAEPILTGTDLMCGRCLLENRGQELRKLDILLAPHDSQLKRSLDGTHHHVSRKHLHRYLGEFDFRYSTRGLSDVERTALLALRLAGRRLSYAPLSATPAA